MSEILGGAWHLQGFAVTDKADMTFRHHRIIKELKFQQRRLTFFDTLTDKINDISNKHSRLFTHDFCIEDNEKANYIYFFCLRAFNILTEKYYLLMTDQRGQNPRYGYSEMRRTSYGTIVVKLYEKPSRVKFPRPEVQANASPGAPAKETILKYKQATPVQGPNLCFRLKPN